MNKHAKQNRREKAKSRIKLIKIFKNGDIKCLIYEPIYETLLFVVFVSEEVHTKPKQKGNEAISDMNINVFPLRFIFDRNIEKFEIELNLKVKKMMIEF